MFNILLIDDDLDIRNSTKEYFDSIGTSDYNLKTCDFTEFEVEIAKQDFHIIISDYKNNHGNPQEGLEVFEKIKRKTFVPLIIYTGFHGSIDHAISDSESCFLRIIAKGTGSEVDLKAAMDEIINSKEFHVKENIEKKLLESMNKNFREYFWTIVQSHWSEFENLDEETLERILSRKIIQDLHPALLANERIHPIEFYEFPVTDKSKIETGSILIKEGKYYICINNDCDLSVREGRCKASKLVLLEIKIGLNALDISGGNNDQLLNNNHSKHRDGKFIFPKTFFFQGGYIDFDDVCTKNLAIQAGKITLDEIGEIVAKVHSPYIQRLISNFSRYYNRVGTPDINTSI